MSDEWQPIETAPKTGRVDLWAKRWMARTDRFTYARFPDCRWNPSVDDRPDRWVGLQDGWRPTHWRPIPAPPKGDAP